MNWCNTLNRSLCSILYDRSGWVAQTTFRARNGLGGYAVAAAAKAEVIVTHNIRHFPNESTAPLGIQALTPYQFLCNLLDLGDTAIHGCLTAMAEQQRNPRRSVEALLRILSREVPIFSSRCLEFLIRPQA